MKLNKINDQSPHMKITNRIILGLILITAVILRFYRFHEIPFMHDEFSALFRTDFKSLRDLIENGIKIDGHPAGIQIFLYYWTMLFGKTEWIVKLPFAVMGVLSVWLVYMVAKKWFNETSALISAAYLASIQYTIMYSQIARPYISGLFFSLLMVLFWTDLMNQNIKNFWKKASFYILASVLCAYNHHFSLLFVVITGISGIFLIPRKFIYHYIFCGILIFLFYTPHLGIFFYQLNTGGVGGWLAKPEKSFLIDFLFYIFNYSAISVLLAMGLVLAGFLVIETRQKRKTQYLLFFVWFTLPLLIGYIYSISINAVLQFSVLIFSFYPLFFILFGHARNQKPMINLLIVVIILTTNIVSLITVRDHYNLFYNSSFEKIVVNHAENKKMYGNITSVIDSHKKITQYYLQKHNADSSFIWFDSFSNEAEFMHFLNNESLHNNYFYFGAWSSNKPNTIPVIRHYFPEIVEEKNYFLGSSYLFRKGENHKAAYSEVLDFTSLPSEYWYSINPQNVSDSVGFDDTRSYFMSSELEWSPTYTRNLTELITHENNYIDVSVKAKSEGEFNEVLLIATLESEGEVVHFSGATFNLFDAPEIRTENWITVFHSLKLADINLKYDDLMLKVFVWNNGRNNFYMDDFSIDVRQGNPFIYGLYEPLPLR
jgi:uncharacterized membrane protein